MKKVFYPLACCLVAGVFTSCGGQKAGNAQDGQTSDKVALSYSKSLKAVEADSLNLPVDKDGYITIFDGETFNGWRGYGKDRVPTKWTIEDGCIKFNGTGGGEAQDGDGGDLIFDNANRIVKLLTFSGEDSGVLFCYKKNMKSIQRVIDTTSLITRLYAYGKDGMTFASINGGNEYVQDTTYTSEIRIATLDCSNFTNPYQMLEYANMRLADYASPRISYVLKAMDLSVLTGYEHETWALGDTVMVKDDDLNLSVKTRIVRREYNLQEPWNTVLELSTTLRELGDSSSRWDSAADTLESTDLIDSQEMKDLVPFNHLRNSRADSGLTYWQNSGFTVDADNGVSGTASFKCEGALNTTKSLSQTITPANRQCYTFSAQIASENLSKGTNGQVGIEVTFEYEDGTTETRFIDLI